jgi:hypothetical protein
MAAKSLIMWCLKRSKANITKYLGLYFTSYIEKGVCLKPTEFKKRAL